MSAPIHFQHPCKTFIEALFVAGILIFASTGARAAPEDDVRAGIEPGRKPTLRSSAVD